MLGRRQPLSGRREKPQLFEFNSHYCGVDNFTNNSKYLLCMVGENGMGCYVMMWLCDLVNWKMMPCELQKTYVTARPLRRKFRCACDPGVINRNKPGKNPRHNSVLQDISPYSKQKGHYSVLQNSTAYQSSLQSSKYASLFEASTKWHSVPQGTTAYHSTLHELPLRTTK